MIVPHSSGFSRIVLFFIRYLWHCLQIFASLLSSSQLSHLQIALDILVWQTEHWAQPSTNNVFMSGETVFLLFCQTSFALDVTQFSLFCSLYWYRSCRRPLWNVTEGVVIADLLECPRSSAQSGA